MTSSREPPQTNVLEPEDAQAPSQVPPEDETETPTERPQRPQRQRRQREQNPALDPRLAQLERARRPSRVGDVSLMVIGIAAFIFGVFMHYYVATSILDDDGDAESAGTTITATATPSTSGSPTVTPSAQPQASATPLPDRTNCDEIRGTQYRSVSEREFFLANCTS